LSLMSMIPTVLERALGVDTMRGAIVLLAWSATTAVTAIGVRWLPVSPRKLLIGGLVGCAVGQLGLYGLGPDTTILHLLPGMVLAGVSNGVLNAALGRQSVASVPADRSAMGSGANNTARYLGSATGLTVCAVIITHTAATSGAAGILAGWNMVVLVTALFSLMAALVVFAVHDRSKLNIAS